MIHYVIVRVYKQKIIVDQHSNPAINFIDAKKKRVIELRENGLMME